MPDLSRLLRDIQDRAIWRVLGVYAVSAWITLLVIQVLSATLGLPPWFPDLALGLLLVGLPPVLALAYLRDRTGGVAPSALDPGSGRVLLRWGAGGLALLLVVAGGLAWLLLRPPGEDPLFPPTPGPRIAILPYVITPQGPPGGAARASGGADPDGGAALARALHRDLLLRLARQEDLTVFSWEAVAGGIRSGGEAGTATPPGGSQEEAVRRVRELGAQVVVVVAVEDEGEALRFRARILDRRGRERWSGDPGASSSSLAATQTALARRILEAAGLAPEPGAGDAAPGDRGGASAGLAPEGSDGSDPGASGQMGSQADLPAFRLRARGRALLAEALERAGEEQLLPLGPGPSDPGILSRLQDAEALLLRGAEAAPDTPEAWVDLAEARLHQARVAHALARAPSTAGLERARSALDRARGALERALRLDPAHPLARLTLGQVLLLSGELPDPVPGLPGGTSRGLQEVARGTAGLPGWAEGHRVLGAAARRGGHWEEALRAWHRAVELEPGVPDTQFELGYTLHLTRHHERAVFHLQEALEGDPSLAAARTALFHATLAHTGNLDAAGQVLDDAPDPLRVGLARFQHHLYGRQFGAAGEVASELAAAQPSPEAPIWMEGPCTVFTPSRMLGTVRAFIGQLEGSRAELLRARGELETRLAPGGDASILAALGEVLALAGEGRAARPLVEQALTLLPPERDAVEGPGCVAALARTRILEGQTREALDLLEWALSLPGPVTRAELRFDPVWEPLRSDSRFQALADAGSP
jgi:tetratricopeptide (TPR) repeat protein